MLEEKASQMTGLASASTLAMTGLSMSSGEPAAHPGDPVTHVRGGGIRIALQAEAHGNLAAFLARDGGNSVIHSLMPARESSRGLEIWDSTISAEAPR